MAFDEPLTCNGDLAVTDAMDIYSVYLVYDIESRTVLHSVKAHQDDVNSVCFAEPTSSQVVFSGSDDHLVKVW
jgi:WD40 repeat protein